MNSQTNKHSKTIPRKMDPNFGWQSLPQTIDPHLLLLHGSLWQSECYPASGEHANHTNHVLYSDNGLDYWNVQHPARSEIANFADRSSDFNTDGLGSNASGFISSVPLPDETSGDPISAFSLPEYTGSNAVLLLSPENVSGAFELQPMQVFDLLVPTTSVQSQSTCQTDVPVKPSIVQVKHNSALSLRPILPHPDIRQDLDNLQNTLDDSSATDQISYGPVKSSVVLPSKAQAKRITSIVSNRRGPMKQRKALRIKNDPFGTYCFQVAVNELPDLDSKSLYEERKPRTKKPCLRCQVQKIKVSHPIVMTILLDDRKI
jgi:hypothetical protein